MNGPPSTADDLFGFVPQFESCSRAVFGRASMNPSMVLTQRRADRVPSNWTLVVPVLNTFKACYFQHLFNAWCAVQHSRSLTFGPKLLNHVVAPTHVMFTPKVAFSINVIGGTTIDAVWIVRRDANCSAGAVLERFVVSEVHPSTAFAVGTPSFSGHFSLCYRGWPHTAATIVSTLQDVHLLSSIDASYTLTTTFYPLRAMNTEVITVTGSGFKSSDTFYLIEGDRDCGSPNATVIAMGKALSSGGPARPDIFASFAMYRIELLLATVGQATVCYNRSGLPFHVAPVTLKPPLTVKPRFVNSVFPVNQSYARGTFVQLELLGVGLSGTLDQAELHANSDCNDSQSINLQYVPEHRAWRGRMTGEGVYVICYQVGTEEMEMVPDHHVAVLPRFYRELLPSTVPIMTTLVLDTVGYGLDLRGEDRDSVWIQRASLACSRFRPALSVRPTSVREKRAVFNVTIGGQLKICYNATQPTTAVLTSTEVFQVTPQEPTRITSTSSNGWMNRRNEIAISGGVGVDLTVLGKVFDCADPNQTALEVVNSTLFAFVPPRLGPFTFCYVNSGIVIQGVPIAAPAPVRLNTNFTAFANIASYTITPMVALAQQMVTVSLDINGGDASDLAHLCNASNRSAVTFTNLYPTTVAIAAVPDTINVFTMVFQRTGSFDLCFSSAAVFPAPSQRFATVIIEPVVSQLTPSAIFTGASTSITMQGIDVAKITALFMVLGTGPSICNVTAGLSPLVRPTPTTFIAGALQRGVYSICYTGISRNVTFLAAAPLVVSPLVLNITVQAAATIYTGCQSSGLISGSGIDPSLDLFYLSTLPSCATLASAPMNLTATVSPNLFAASFVPIDAGKYFLCYAANGALQTAGANFGAIVVQEPIQFTDNGAQSFYALQYLCAFPSGARFSFDILAREGGNWMPLDDLILNPRLTIRYLPVQIPLRIRVNVSANNVTTHSNTAVVTASSPFVLCSQLPTLFAGSFTKQFAESIFSMMNFHTLQCSNFSGSSNVALPLLHARNLLTATPLLMTDAVVIVTAMANALRYVSDPSSILTILQSTVPALTPYQAIPEDELQAQLLLMSNAFSGMLQNLQATPAGQSLAVFVLNHLVQLGTTFCGRGTSRDIRQSHFALNVVKALPGAVRGSIAVSGDSAAVIDVEMVTPSSVGYCFVSVSLPHNIVPAVDGTRGRSFASAAITGPSTFNLPLFVLAANPYAASAASDRINRLLVTLQYPASLQPSTPSTINGTLFAFEGSRWNAVRQATLAGEYASRTLRIAMPAPNSTVTVSGGIEFELIVARVVVEKDQDMLVLVMGICIAAVTVLCLLIAKCYDYAIECDGGIPDFSEEDIDRSVLGYRYLVIFGREAYHPVSTGRRAAHIAVYLAAAFIAVVLIVRYAPYDTYVASGLGLLPGLCAALMATGGAAVVRVLLFQQLHDTPSILAGALTVSAGAIATSFSNFGIGIAAMCVLGPISFLMSGLAARNPTRVVSENAAIGAVAGWVLTAVTLVFMVVVGFYYGLQDVLPKEARASRVALVAWLWAVAFDVVLLEPVKQWLLPRFHAWVARRAADALAGPSVSLAAVLPPTAPGVKAQQQQLPHDPFRFVDDETQSMRSTLDDMSEVFDFDEVDYKSLQREPSSGGGGGRRGAAARTSKSPFYKDSGPTSPSEVSVKTGFESVSRPSTAQSLSEMDLAEKAVELESATDFESVRSESTTSYAAVPPPVRSNSSFVVNVRDPYDSSGDDGIVQRGIRGGSGGGARPNPVDLQFPSVRNRRFVMPY